MNGTTDIWVSLLTALGGGIPAVIAVVLSNRSHDKVIDERMKNMTDRISELSTRVEKHNNLIERMAVAERDIKSAHRRIDEVNSQLKVISVSRPEKAK